MSKEMKLVDALQMFNRKEQYWVIRNAFQNNSNKLHPYFIKSLEETLSIKVPNNAWWAMEFHIDWLVGALHLAKYKDEESAYGIINNQKGVYDASVGDFDFIVASDKTLIFIESKCDADWNYRQLYTKFNRLQNIADAKYFDDVELYFILMSPDAEQEIIELCNSSCAGMRKGLRGVDYDAKIDISIMINETRLDSIFAKSKPQWMKLRIMDENYQNELCIDNLYRMERCRESKDVNGKIVPCGTGKSFHVKKGRN